MSKSHPKQSSRYSQMLEVRNRRELDRQMQRKAKELILKEKGVFSKKLAHQVTALKKKLIAELERETPAVDHSKEGDTSKQDVALF